MPSAALRPCSKPGCRTLVAFGRCPAHQVARVSTSGSVDPFYSTARWRAIRRAYLKKHPFCARCGVAATHLDHVVPRSVDPSLQWERSNFQGLCPRCHARKTASQDGGYGNRRANHPTRPGGVGISGEARAASVLCSQKDARAKLESGSGTVLDGEST